MINNTLNLQIKCDNKTVIKQKLTNENKKVVPEGAQVAPKSLPNWCPDPIWSPSGTQEGPKGAPRAQNYSTIIKHQTKCFQKAIKSH